MTRRFLALLVAMLLAVGAPMSVARAAAPLVNVTIEPSQIVMGQSAELSITTSGAIGSGSTPVPEVPGLEMRVVGQSHRLEIINGATLASTALIVRVTPAQPGVYTIPGPTPQSPPLILRVFPENSPQAGGLGRPNGFGGPPPGAAGEGIRMTADGSAFMRMLLPKRDVYVGESIPVDIEVGMRSGFVTSLNGLPTLNGSDFTLNNLSRQPERTERLIDGKPYTVMTWHSVLAPVKPGKFTLTVQSPVTVRVRTRSPRESMLDDMLGDPFLQNFFGATVSKDITVTSPAADLTVLALPVEGRPADFSGAVGSFKVATDVSATKAGAGDPITLRLHVTGAGNFDRVDTSMLEHLDRWKTYPPKSTFKAADAIGYKGEKTFEQPLIAAEPGTHVLPPLSFSYFNPVTRRYESAHGEPLTVDIAPSLADAAAGPPAGAGAAGPSPGAAPPVVPAAPPLAAAAPPHDADPLRPDHAIAAADDARTLVPLSLRPAFLAVPSLLALGIAGGWLGRRHGTRTILPLRRRRTRPHDAAPVLARLEAAAAARDPVTFFNAARAALAAQRAAPPAAHPAEAADTGPADPAETAETADDDAAVREIFALADEANYSGAAPNPADYRRWTGAVRRRLTARMLVLCAVAATAFAALPAPAAQPPAPQPPAHGYSAASLYDSGNAYARAGKPALAIVNYERARLLTPNDPDLAANLRYVRGAAHLPTPAPSWAERVVTALSPTLAAGVGVGGLVLLGAGILAWRMRPTPRIALGTLGAALLCLSAGNAAVLWPLLHEAVVLTAATPVRVSPAPMSDELFTLSEAQTVTIAAEHEDFLLVRTGDGRTGWIARAQLAPVVPPGG